MLILIANDQETVQINQTIAQGRVSKYLLTLFAMLLSVSCSTSVNDPALYSFNLMTLDFENIKPIKDKPEFSDSDVQATADQYFEAIVDGINKRDAKLIVDVLSASVDLDQESTTQMFDLTHRFLEAFPSSIKGGQYVGYDSLGVWNNFLVISVTYELVFPEKSSEAVKMKIYLLVGKGVHSFRGFQYGV